MKYNEVKGDLIKLALQGEFDVITHGCNCQCVMGSGIAPQMAKAFGCDMHPLEGRLCKGDYNKLGQIDFRAKLRKNNFAAGFSNKLFPEKDVYYIVNSYTQFQPGKNLDYEALTLCLRKINYIFKGYHIGLPLIGCGLAGGDWDRVKQIIQTELKDMDITVVIYQK